MMIRLLTFFLLIITGTLYAQDNGVADYRMGMTTALRGGYTDALSWFLKAANNKNGEAMLQLGRMYELGAGVEKDSLKSIEWYEKAVAQRNIAAMNRLEELQKQNDVYFPNTPENDYKDGLASYNRKSWNSALALLYRAAGKGHVGALTLIGVMYERGNGIVQSYAEAFRCWEQAAAKGDANSMYYLGEYHNDYNKSHKRDYAKALDWYRKATENGHLQALVRIGQLHENGRGVPKNLNEARKWYQKAADNGSSDARKILENLK